MKSFVYSNALTFLLNKFLVPKLHLSLQKYIYLTNIYINIYNLCLIAKVNVSEQFSFQSILYAIYQKNLIEMGGGYATAPKFIRDCGLESHSQLAEILRDEEEDR